MENRKSLALGLLGALFALAPMNTRAAVAPKSPEDLKKEALHILSGEVTEVTSRTGTSKVEKAWGIHRDRFYRIRLKVNTVSKGTGVGPGETVDIAAWQAGLRIPPLPGPQGHGPIPRKGDTVTVYLKGKDGKAYTPLLPNGIFIETEAD